MALLILKNIARFLIDVSKSKFFIGTVNLKRRESQRSDGDFTFSRAMKHYLLCIYIGSLPI